MIFATLRSRESLKSLASSVPLQELVAWGRVNCYFAVFANFCSNAHKDNRSSRRALKNGNGIAALQTASGPAGKVAEWRYHKKDFLIPN